MIETVTVAAIFHRHHHSQSIQRYCIVASVVYFLLLQKGFVSAANDNNQDEASDVTISTATDQYYESDNNTDRVVIAIFTIFCTVCLSIISSIIVYCVRTEELILRTMLDDGSKIQAKVVDYSPLQTQQQHKQQRDRTVTIDYRYHNRSNSQSSNKRDVEIAVNDDVLECFGTIVRKRIKCIDADIVAVTNKNETTSSKLHAYLLNQQLHHPQQPQHSDDGNIKKSSFCIIEIEKSTTVPNNDDSIDDDNAQFPSFDNNIAVFEAKQSQQHYIDVLVLRNQYPGSAIGYQYILRSLQQQQQYPIRLLILCLFVLSFFCMHVAVINLSPTDITVTETVVVTMVVIIAMLTVEILAIHFYLQNSIFDLIWEEYVVGCRKNSDDNNKGTYYLYKTEDETFDTVPTVTEVSNSYSIMQTYSTALSWKTPASSPTRIVNFNSHHSSSVPNLSNL